MNIRLLLVTAIALVAAPALAGSMTYNFSQGGYAEGAMITGFFVGEDLDGNGELVYFGEGTGPAEGDIGLPEITDFALSFSGNSLVAAFTAGYDDLFGLVYLLDGGPLGDNATGGSEGIGVSLPELEYLAGPGPLSGAPCDNSTVVCGTINLFVEGPGGFDETFEWVEINPVPVPAALPLMVFALGALGFMRRRA